MNASPLVDLSPFTALVFHKDTEKLKSFMSILRWCGLKDMVDVVQLKEAIEQLVSKRFDLIFVTHVGEAAETTQLIDELKSLDATSDIPLIAITADGEIKNIMRILAKGVDEVIVTPLSRKSVENAALKILQKHTGAESVKNKLDYAKELIKTEQFEAAIELYMELIVFGKSLFDAHLGLGAAYSLTEQWKDAESHLKKALELAKSADTKLDIHVQLAEVFFHYGNMYNKRDAMEKALKCYQTSVSLNTFHTGSIKALLELLQRCNEEDEIIRLIGEVRANFVPYSRAMEEMALSLGNMAQRFTDMNMPSQARKIYEQLLQISHANVDVHLKVADFFLEEGLLSQVLERLITLLQKLKDADILYKTGGIFLDLQKRYLSGSGQIDAVKDLDLSFLGDLNGDKALSMAERMFQQGLLLEPESPRFLLGLVRCYICLGQGDAAGELLEKLKEEYAENVHGFEEVIDILLTEKAYNYAHAWIQDAINRFPEEAIFYSLFSRYYIEQGRPYDAIGCLKRCMSINPSHVESMISLAELYEEIKEFSDSIYYYEMAIKIKPDDLKLQEKLARVLKRKYAK
ncbi:MAG TPA: tetratricopeptide repeat protein [Syntrophobacteraceae bacterium]|nr:tetratricopeptide repeat protein [Syntrophobacteraceae bacterium]